MRWMFHFTIHADFVRFTLLYKNIQSVPVSLTSNFVFFFILFVVLFRSRTHFCFEAFLTGVSIRISMSIEKYAFFTCKGTLVASFDHVFLLTLITPPFSQ